MNLINSLNLELLRVLHLIIETRSLTQTASKLGLTQSAVSHSLKKLRLFFEDELVYRNGNSLDLTDKATALEFPLKQWLLQLENILMSEDFIPQKSKRTYYIATTDIAERLLAPDLIKIMQKEAPNIKLCFVKWEYPRVQSQLLNSEVDMAIGVRTFDNPNIMQRVLYEEEFISAVKKNHPLIKKNITLEDFISYPHVMTGPGDGRGAVDNYLESLNRKRELLYSVSNFSSAPALVESSHCVLTAPKRFLEHISKFHKLHLFEPPLKMKKFKIQLYWTKKNHKDKANIWLRELLYKISK